MLDFAAPACSHCLIHLPQFLNDATGKNGRNPELRASPPPPAPRPLHRLRHGADARLVARAVDLYRAVAARGDEAIVSHEDRVDGRRVRDPRVQADHRLA
eukprot:5359665-Prymnesium_polylepis.1